MVINTHRVLSTIIYDKTYENLNFRLEFNYFLWGNIKPDVIPNLVIKSHYKAESLDLVINEILKLSKTPDVFQNLKAYYAFSEKIGVICHFLSDFFCMPHNKQWFLNSSKMLSHLKYENKLNKMAQNTQSLPELSLASVDKMESETLKSYIETNIEEYSLKEDYRNDMIYASNICAKIIEAVVLSINKEHSNKIMQIA
ncbi:zinc dependent phospholipase C family protein [Dehalobacter sp. TeCB1]|uniref:zinc dependent phospholipase C family protein n=1 Tax=Dehalobacter sp. TeCB1 TaxID=1843715 RepID=UPI00083AFFBE|nr:zinc dependent phospholipase C family protein [Dehalobacter sp. TeCB1]OCZ49837.1 hypothetical protein A7D23_00365 [Dehalobacter sp. TeCB1]